MTEQFAINNYELEGINGFISRLLYFYFNIE